MIPLLAKCIKSRHLGPAVLLYFGTDGVDGDSLQFRGREVAQKHLVLAAVGVQEPLILVRWQHLGDVAFRLTNAEGLVIEFRTPDARSILGAGDGSDWSIRSAG